MPNRIVRDGLLDSRAVNSLSEAGELFYRRLMHVVDDYGRHQADPDILRARCFPIQLDKWPTARVASALAEVGSAMRLDGRPLVLVYSALGKQWLEITEFNQRFRAKSSRCPSPDGQVTSRCPSPDGQVTSRCPSPDGQVTGTCQHSAEKCGSKSILPSTSSSSSTSSSTTTEPHPNAEPGLDYEADFESLWSTYPAKGRVRRIEAQQAFVDVCRNADTFRLILASVQGKWSQSEKWAKGYIMALPSWLRQECWNEDPPSVEGESGPQYTRAE